MELGGAEGQLAELVMHLDATRFEPRVCCLFSGGPHLERLRHAGIPVEVAGFEGFRKGNPGRVVFQLANFHGLIRRVRPDIVHGFLFWAYVLGALAARVAGVPVIISSRRSLSHFKAGWPYRFFVPLERVANRVTDLIVANSEAVRQDAVSNEHVSPGKVIVVHNGIDADRYPAKPDEQLQGALNLQNRTPVVGVIANFIHYKGHRFFLEAWARVVSRFPSAVALLVGDGPLRRECETQVATTGLQESVCFLGGRQDIPAILSVLDLVVQPSLEEGFSNTILEAMAAAKPVVATAVGGNPEAVMHERTGLLVPPQDSGALADAMLWLAERPRLAAAWGEVGRRRVLEQFQLSTMVRRYEAVYESLLNQKRGGRTPARPMAG